MTADPTEDQIEAATQEAHQLFTNASTLRDTLERACSKGSVGFTIGERFLDSLDPPQARMCPHVQGPQPIYGAASLPGLVGCGNCMIPLINAKEMAEQIAGKGRTCDGCGDKVAKWHDALIQRGPMLIHVNVCCFCMQMSELDDAPETD